MQAGAEKMMQIVVTDYVAPECVVTGAEIDCTDIAGFFREGIQFVEFNNVVVPDTAR